MLLSLAEVMQDGREFRAGLVPEVEVAWCGAVGCHVIPVHVDAFMHIRSYACDNNHDANETNNN